MTVAVEFSARAIRLAAVEDGAVILLRTAACEAGADPIQLLAGLLPAKPGAVRVLVADESILMRVFVQPPCPRERLDRLVAFELVGGHDDDAPLTDWHVVPGFGSGDLRVLGLAAKRDLIRRLHQAVELAGGRLESVTHPAVALYHAWRRAGGMGDALLADVGGASTHVAVVRQDELALVRTLPVGMDVLVAQVAELRSLSPGEASRLVGQLRATSPEELQHLVRRQAGQVAVAVSGAIKFAKAQLQIDDWQPTAIALAGAGAQVHGFAEALGDRAGVPARPFNPFAPLRSAVPADEMDAQAALPTPWAAVLGAAGERGLPLIDAIADERRAAARFWATDGVLRVGVALCALLVVVGLVLHEQTRSRSEAVADRLGRAEGGLVPLAEAGLAEVTALEQAHAAAATRLGWLDGEHRASRIAGEILTAVTALQHPESCPVALTAYRLRREPGQVVVELEGFAQAVGRLRTSDVLQQFQRGLRQGYPQIAAVDERPRSIDRDRQLFHLVLRIPDHGP